MPELKFKIETQEHYESMKRWIEDVEPRLQAMTGSEEDWLGLYEQWSLRKSQVAYWELSQQNKLLIALLDEAVDALGTTKVERYDTWVLPFIERVKQAKGG